ncbi:MAG: DUF1328 family protein [Bdellovibrionales bacterium]
MLRAAILFFVLGLVAIFFGAGQIAGVSLATGKLLLGLFLILAVISLIMSLIGGRKKPTLP